MKKPRSIEKRQHTRSRLREEREHRGWSLEYVATQMNCPDPHMIGRWERGSVFPSPRYRQALCELFGKNAEELGLLPNKPDEIREQAPDRSVLQSGEEPYSPRSSSQEYATAEDRPFVPSQLTSFVGRTQELSTVCELLRQSDVRLLTLTGTGGVGKTRLAVQALTHLAHDFADGVRFLSLMETSTPSLVVPTIAHKLGIQEIGSQPVFDLLKAFLKEKHLLLLLDNFEQVVQAAAMLPDLLSCCPHLKLLITSRTILRVSGEYEVHVPPLAFPSPLQVPEKERLAQYPAIALFLERARMVLPNFTMNESNVRLIAEICAHLDGLPLAIELAVPRLKVLSLQELLTRLDHRLDILNTGVRDAPVRQQTLRNTLAWSYRLLNPLEQRLFCYLSVFIDGCTLQAIETIWATLEGQQDKGQVLDGIASLLDKTMLQCRVQEGEESRLFMLSTIREYGLEQLSLDGRLEQAQWAYASYYLALAEEAESALKGPQPLPWLECLEREHDNLREALCCLIEHGERGNSLGMELALRLGKALEQFWIIRGYVKEGRDLLERALKQNQGVSLSIRGYATHTTAVLAGLQFDLDYAQTASEENLRLFRELEDAAGIARSLCRLGATAQMRGEYIIARSYYEESLDIARKSSCKEPLSETLYHCASMALFQGDIDTARAISDECLALLRELNDQQGIAAGFHALAWITLLQGDTSAAHALEEKYLDTSRMLGNQHGVAHALSTLGHIAVQEGDLTQAYTCFAEGLSTMIRLGDRWMVAFCLEGLVRVALAQGEATWAVQLLSTAMALRSAIGVSISPLEQWVQKQILTVLHKQLDEQVFTTAWNEGQTMSPEQAIAARGQK